MPAVGRLSAPQVARKYRKPVSVAVVGLLAALVAACLWLWLAQKDAETVGAAQEALRRAGVLQAQGRWSEALEAAQHAESLLQLAVGSPDLRQRLQRMVTDMNMLRGLEDIRLEQTATKDDSFDMSAADPLYAAAFREYGVDVENLEAGEAGERIRARPIYLELAAALDDWAHVRRGSVQGEARRAGRICWLPPAWPIRIVGATSFGMPWSARGEPKDPGGPRGLRRHRRAAGADPGFAWKYSLACRRCPYGGHRAAPGPAALSRRLLG